MVRLLGPIDIDPAVEGVAVGLLYAGGCTAEPSPEELLGEVRATTAERKAGGGDEGRTKAVRDMLRFGKYKPTGRGKPASEYLLRAATQDQFPAINQLVDMINLVSLRQLLPISLIDVGRSESRSFRVRRGQKTESYIFNSAGQSIDLEDLLLVSALPADRPLANPIKDSMIAKLTDSSRDVLAVIYAPVSLREALAQATSELESLFARFGKAETLVSAVEG